MEPLPQKIGGGPALGGRGVRLAALLVPLALSLGCVSMGGLLPASLVPAEPVCQVVATWDHQVHSTPDPVHDGALTPGLVGRMYLFGQEVSCPLVGDGGVTVYLYDDGPTTADGKSPLLEKWSIDKDTLRRLLRRDAFGWGYTLFLPWGTYRPDIRAVHLKVCYQPLKGTPLYCDSGPLSLDHGRPLPPPLLGPALSGRGAQRPGGGAVANTQPEGPKAKGLQTTGLSTNRSGVP